MIQQKQKSAKKIRKFQKLVKKYRRSDVVMTKEDEDEFRALANELNIDIDALDGVHGLKDEKDIAERVFHE